MTVIKYAFIQKKFFYDSIINIEMDFKDATVVTSCSVQLSILYQNCTKAQRSAARAPLTVSQLNTHICLHA